MTCIYLLIFTTLSKYDSLDDTPTYGNVEVNTQHLVFSSMEIGIVELLHQAPRQKRFLLVAIDYFIKWIEVESYAQIQE